MHAWHILPRLCLLISDVPGDDPSLIASGPTVQDRTTLADAEKIIRKYNVDTHPDLKNYILYETPKQEKYFERVTNLIILNNEIMLQAMQDKADELGYKAEIKPRTLEGQVENVADYLLEHQEQVQCSLYGGETTVTIRNQNGKGGRCQELALYAGIKIEADTVVLAASSDGHDNSNVAAAFMSQRIQHRARELNIDIHYLLENNLSYDFFDQAGGHVFTGQTGINISDVYMVLRSNSQ